VKILITGGFGNLGSWVSKYFIDQEYDITILAMRKREVLKDKKYKVIQADISDISNLRECLTETFDYCIHIASLNDYFLDNYSESALRVNTLGTRNLLEIFAGTSIKKFIYISTIHVYSQKLKNISETSNVYPENDYASTHLFAEYYIKQFHISHNLPYIIFRLSNSYGAPLEINSSKWYLALNDLVRQAFMNNKIALKSNGNVSRDFIWMGDVCLAIEKIIMSDILNKTYNLSSGYNYKIIDLAKKVQNVYENRYGEVVPITVNIDDKKEYLKMKIDNKKLRLDLDIVFSDKFFEEINCIFDLLENK